MTILVVDDEPAIQQHLVRVLIPQGYKVLEARHAFHALELYTHYSDPIHLLLTDIVIPDMKGHELASCALAARPQMRVLYMSGYTDSLPLPSLDVKQAVAFLPKPFSPDALLQKVRDVLAQ